MALHAAFAVTEVGSDAVAGDYFTALELGSALSLRFGWGVTYLPRGDAWYDLSGIDILVVMLDDYDLRLIRRANPSLVRVAWARNWFERWCQNPCVSYYQLLMASSLQAARYMSEQTGRLVKLMRIATNQEGFDPCFRGSVPTWDVVFTGSYWQSEREIVDVLLCLPSTIRVAVYGKNWEQVPELCECYQGFVPYGELSSVYAQANIVIDDANHVTKAWGAANSRVFDALAAGCLVISNSVSVSDEVFGGLLPVYRSPQDLAQMVNYFLCNTQARDNLQTELRDMVLKQHLYKHRAMEFALLLKHATGVSWHR